MQWCLARNGGRRAYRAARAEERALDRARRPKPCHLAFNPSLCKLVAGKLSDQWSPEQIAGWLKALYPGDASMNVSYETIYISASSPWPPTSASTSVIRKALGRAEAMKTPMACCANASRMARTYPFTHNMTLITSPSGSKPDPEKRLASRRQLIASIKPLR